MPKCTGLWRACVVSELEQACCGELDCNIVLRVQYYKPVCVGYEQVPWAFSAASQDELHGRAKMSWIFTEGIYTPGAAVKSPHSSG